MKREHALTKLRVAGYHDDRATFTRTYVEERVSYAAAKAAYAEGRAARARGVPCDCHDCKTEKTAANN
jgi:hypothetical protein